MSTVSYVNAPIDETLVDKIGRLAAVKTRRGDVLDISGLCPRCDHFVHFAIHRREFGIDAGARGPNAKAPEVALHCNCAHAHPGDSKEDGGCGVWFGALLEASPKLQPARHFGISLYEENSALMRDQLALGELDRVRSAASSWKTGLAALVGLIPTLVVVKGTDAVNNLGRSDKIIVGGLIAFGAALAMTATLLALRAAYGPLRRHTVDGDDPTIRHLSEVQRTILVLNVTRILTVVGSAAFAAAIAYTWAGG